MKKKKFLSMFCIISTLLVLTSCGKNWEKSNSKEEETSLIMAIEGDPGENINPLTSNSRYSLMASNMIYSPLYRMSDGNINYVLAKSLSQSEDGLIYTIKLKKDILWSDGEKLSAEDVVFTLNKILEEKNNTVLHSDFVFNDKKVKVDKRDDLTVDVTLPNVSENFNESLSKVYILPKHIYKDEKNIEQSEKNITPIGTGAYKLASNKIGDYSEYVKNPKYSLGKVDIDKFIFKVIEDNNTAKTAMKKGDIDILRIKPEELSEFKEVKNLKTYKYDEGGIVYLKLNQKMPELNKKDIREGLLYSLNRNDLLKAAYGNEDNYTIADSFLPQKNPWYNSEVNSYEYNQDKGKEKLKNSDNIERELKLIFTSGNTYEEKMALVIQKQLSDNGIKVNVKGLDGPVLGKTVVDPENMDYDMFISSYNMSNDPNGYRTFFDTKSNNMFHYNNPKIDELFAKAQVEINQEERRKLYDTVQKEVSNEAIFYPIGSAKTIVLTKDTVASVDNAKLTAVTTFEDFSKLTIK